MNINIIPDFYTDRINFVRFIQGNRDAFEKLIAHNFNEEHGREEINAGYYYFANLNLRDPDEVHDLTEGLETYLNHLNHVRDLKARRRNYYDIHMEAEPNNYRIINAFVTWLQQDEVIQTFEQLYNETLQHALGNVRVLNTGSLNKIQEIGENRRSKSRTMKRTAQVKDELLDIDYVPENNPNSVKGKTYRSTRDEFNTRNNIGGKKKNKTKKYGKSRRLKRKRRV